MAMRSSDLSGGCPDRGAVQWGASLRRGGKRGGANFGGRKKGDPGPCDVGPRFGAGVERAGAVPHGLRGGRPGPRTVDCRLALRNLGRAPAARKCTFHPLDGHSVDVSHMRKGCVNGPGCPKRSAVLCPPLRRWRGRPRRARPRPGPRRGCADPLRRRLPPGPGAERGPLLTGAGDGSSAKGNAFTSTAGSCPAHSGVVRV
jgi:hypothetical protein